jgi:PAS domain S-box-containing protein
MSAFPSEYEEKRVSTLRLYDILDTLPEEDFDNITRLASEICQTPIALISLVDDHRQWFKSRVGLECPETPKEISFCAHAIQQDDIFEVVNATEDNRFRTSPLVTSNPHIRFYAGAPLVTNDGYRLGTLCVINTEPTSISLSQKNSLKILARSVMSLLELRREKKEAELFRLGLDEVSAVSVYNSSLVFEYVNEKFCELAAMSAGELIGKSIREVALATLSPAEKEEAINTIKNGNTFRATVRNQNQNGQISWSHLALIPFTSGNGNLVKVLSVRNDVTNEVTLLERLQEAEGIAETGNWEYNLITGKRFWSKGLLKILGYDEHADLATLPSIQDMTSGDDKEKLTNAIAETKRGNQVSELDITITAPNGNEMVLQINTKARLNIAGEVTAIYGTVQNITHKKTQEKLLAESEAKYRALVEESAQMTYTTDATGVYTYASAHLKKTIGYDDCDILGKKFAFIYDDDWRKKVIGFYVDQLEKEISETRFSFPIITHERQKMWVEQTAQLIYDEQGIAGFRCVLHDITERVATEEKMAEAVRLADEARQMQQNFLSRMSHEVRTPMNGVIGMLNLLEETVLTEKQRIYISSIRESANNTLRIINDILDVSKIEAGKLIFEDTEIDVAQIVGNVVMTLKPAADEKRILIASHVDPAIPKQMLADPVRLNQVLLNLAGNAIKFTERGSVVISVSPKDVNKHRITLEFKVADTGIGIASDKIKKVFESFTQAEVDTTRKYGGTGLGLTIAKQIVEQQEGAIEIESEYGKGTTFTFTFHFKPCHEPEIAKNVPESKIQSLKGYNILLVEDNPMNQRVASFTLENWDADVTIADRGWKAIELLKKNKYDVILMDIQMPEMNGIQTTEIIRNELGDNTPIIAMTASAMSVERDRCLAAGMNSYVSKPFSPEDLNNKIVRNASKPASIIHSGIIDIQHMKDLANSDNKFVKEILGLYVLRAPEMAAKIEKYITDKDYELLCAEVHNLKNSVSILGAKGLYELLQNAEIDTYKKEPGANTVSNLMKAIHCDVIPSINEAKKIIDAL